jgi:hypothetical protein
MCRRFGWHRFSSEKAEAREGFEIAMTQEFNTIYGTNGEDIQVWQEFCRVLGIVPVPKSLSDCQQVSVISRLCIQLSQLIVGAKDDPHQSRRFDRNQKDWLSSICLPLCGRAERVHSSNSKILPEERSTCRRTPEVPSSDNSLILVK